MGIMLCPVHGRSGFAETCSHVSRALDAGHYPSGRHFRIVSEFFICDECFDACGFDRCISLADLPEFEAVDVVDGRLEAFDDAYDRIPDRGGFCLRCLEDLKKPAQELARAPP